MCWACDLLTPRCALTEVSSIEDYLFQDTVTFRELTYEDFCSLGLKDVWESDFCDWPEPEPRAEPRKAPARIQIYTPGACILGHFSQYGLWKLGSSLLLHYSMFESVCCV